MGIKKILRSRRFIGALSILGVGALLFPLLTMGLACDNGNSTATQTPFQALDSRVASIEGNYARSTEISSIANDINGLRKDIDALVATAGKDWSGDISTLSGDIVTLTGNVSALSGNMTLLQTTLINIELALLDIEARLVSLEAGGTPTTTDPLELALLSASPVIVSDGNYSFTVRVTNTAVQPETGRIVLQLYAYSGSVAVTSVGMTGSPSFMAAEYDPVQTAAKTITIFSDSIVIGASSSKIYEFTLVLDQGGAAFEWVDMLAIAQ